MWDFLKQCQGEMPEREQIVKLAEKTGLSYKVTKKWLWDQIVYKGFLNAK